MTWDFTSDHSALKSHAVARAGTKTGEQEAAVPPEAGPTGWQEKRNRDAARGDGEQENGIWLENRNRDAARGTENRRTGKYFFSRCLSFPGPRCILHRAG